MLNTAFGSGMDRYKQKLLWKEELKEIGITEKQGRYLLAMANLDGILNKQAYGSAEEHWVDAPFAEFRGDRTLWGYITSMTWSSQGSPCFQIGNTQRYRRFYRADRNHDGKL